MTTSCFIKSLKNGKYESLAAPADELIKLFSQKIKSAFETPLVSESADNGIELSWHFQGDIHLTFDLLLDGTVEWFARDHTTGKHDGEDALNGFDFINNEKINTFIHLINKRSTSTEYKGR